MKPAGIILAAGASRRMGWTKALLTISGECFLDRLIRIIAPGVSTVSVVLGFDADRVRSLARRLDEALVVVNPDPGRGQLSSLQCGLRAIPPEAPGVLFTPVDYAGVREETVQAVLASWGKTQPPVLAPRFAGRRGHPVCVQASVAAEILALSPNGQAREVIRRYSDQAQYVDVEDPAVLMDVDVPADYEELKAVVEPL